MNYSVLSNVILESDRNPLMPDTGRSKKSKSLLKLRKETNEKSWLLDSTQF